MNFFKYILILTLFSCTQKDEYFISPIDDFELSKYLGKWYEIARTDNSFEKGCANVTANYALRSDGGIDVLNECITNGKPKKAMGRGYFKNSSNIGSLKVTFFWPFYGNYYILYVDKNYSHAIVYGGSPKYIWILSRSEKISKTQLEDLLFRIRNFGLNPKSLTVSDSAILDNAF